jgi:hypothetical protein
MSASTIDEFKALMPIDTYFTFEERILSLMSRYQLQDLWARHPLRQGKRKWRVLFRKGILIQHLILSDNLIAF